MGIACGSITTKVWRLVMTFAYVDGGRWMHGVTFAKINYVLTHLRWSAYMAC